MYDRAVSAYIFSNQSRHTTSCRWCYCSINGWFVAGIVDAAAFSLPPKMETEPKTKRIRLSVDVEQ